MTPCGTHILFVPPKRQSKQEKCKKLRKLKENSRGGGGGGVQKLVECALSSGAQLESGFDFQEAPNLLSEDQFLQDKGHWEFLVHSVLSKVLAKVSFIYLSS